MRMVLSGFGARGLLGLMLMAPGMAEVRVGERAIVMERRMEVFMLLLGEIQPQSRDGTIQTTELGRMRRCDLQVELFCLLSESQQIAFTFPRRDIF